jgi:thioredoxin reductase (NADPH)
MLVVGAGIAGLTAAWHGARHGLAVGLIERGSLYGGQIATLGVIDDFPSTVVMSGADLAATLVDACRRAGASIAEDEVTSVAAGDGLIQVRTTQWVLRARHVVVATGASLRRLEVPGAAGKEGQGISQCASCDGPLCRGRDVVVVGGGDSALQEALEVAHFAARVKVVVRGPLCARQTYIDAASKCANLTFSWDSIVERVLGEHAVEGVRIRHTKTGQTFDYPCFAVFPFLGTTPNAAWLPASLERTPSGLVRVNAALESSMANVHAVGAARAGFSGSLASAAGDAASVAERVARFLRK